MLQGDNIMLLLIATVFLTRVCSAWTMDIGLLLTDMLIDSFNYQIYSDQSHDSHICYVDNTFLFRFACIPHISKHINKS